MRPHPLLLSSLLAAVAPAQEIRNPSLLRAPDDAAPATWSSRTFEQVQASVVWVAVEADGPRGRYVFERPSSGVVVDRSGLVVTFSHLIDEAVRVAGNRLFVQLNDAANTRLPAEVVAQDAATGLALLRIAPPAAGLQAARLGPDEPDYGEPLLVVARPYGEDMQAFAGVASRALSDVSVAGQRRARDEVFLTDARSDARCDGAPVFGADGALLGLYSAEHVQREVAEPTLADLKQPSFGVLLNVGLVRRAFAEPFAAAADGRLRAAPARPPHPWSVAVARVAPSVVAVHAGAGSAASPKDPGCVQRRAGVGSGVVLSRSGLVVANAHVVAADRVEVVVAGRRLAAKVLRRDPGSNLALLRVELPDGVALEPAVCAADDDVLLGEAVLAVGNPTGAGVVVSKGVVSAMRAREGGRVQADANLGNQNGGGAVVDATGVVLGVGDAGRIDPVEMAWAMRRDRAQQETNLSTFVGIRQVRQVFERELDGLDAADAPITAPPARSSAELTLRRSTLTGMVAKVQGALLNIYVARNVAEIDPEDPFPPDPVWRPMSLGSGVVVDPTGLAISNWHVVDDATNPDGSSVADHRVTARVFSGKEYEVRVLSISREDDLSLLQLVLDPGETVPFVELGSSERLAIGEAVAAIGNPHGRANTITYGVATAKGDAIRVRGRWAKLKHLIETDAAINGGNSGGALLDMAGRLVGINSAGGGTFNNKGYAIAVDHVRRQLTGLLLQPYKLRSPDLGMRVLDDEPGTVVVMDVDPRGPAARAGVRSGDRVVALAGQPVAWTPGFARQLMALEPGAEVPLVVARDGAERTVAVAPVAPEVWSVVRQSGLQVRDFGYVEDPERVRRAAVAVHRAFVGDPDGEPTRIPAGVVLVERVYADAGEEPALQAGDLLLAVELPSATGQPALLPLAGVTALRDLFNDGELGKTPDVDHYKVPAEYAVWVARDGEVRKVAVRARRLLW